MGVAVFQAKPKPDEPTGGHGRGTSTGKRDPEPRVPLIGVDSGFIPGTKPGQWIGQGAELDRAAQDLSAAGQAIVRRKMREARKRLKQGPQQV